MALLLAVNQLSVDIGALKTACAELGFEFRGYLKKGGKFESRDHSVFITSDLSDKRAIYADFTSSLLTLIDHGGSYFYGSMRNAYKILIIKGELGIFPNPNIHTIQIVGSQTYHTLPYSKGILYVPTDALHNILTVAVATRAEISPVIKYNPDLETLPVTVKGIRTMATRVFDVMKLAED